jgi:glucosamine-6-phosphate deaminase
VEGPVTEAVSASFLQEHEQARFFIDAAAARELTRIKLPWLVGPVKWSPKETRRAVCWLSATLGKPVLKLTDEEYNEHGLSDLLSEQGPAYQLNIRIFNQLQHTISGWPGGKPNADDTFRPERAKPYPKRCLLFSPEPQDVVVNIGSTLDRLIEQTHEVRLVSMTSGNLRVPDNEADKFSSILLEIASASAKGWDEQTEYARHILKLLEEKGEFGEDPPDVRALKSLILRGELRDAAQTLGLPVDHVQFLDLPFYEKGRYRRFKLTQADIDATACVLKEFKPHQVYLTGEAADPSSVAALCFRAAIQALQDLQNEDWAAQCSVWFFRGREKAMEPWEIDMAVPCSPMQLERKTRALSRYQSLTSMELDSPKTNQHSAQQYDALGLANYEAIESFQRWQRK